MRNFWTPHWANPGYHVRLPCGIAATCVISSLPTLFWKYWLSGTIICGFNVSRRRWQPKGSANELKFSSFVMLSHGNLVLDGCLVYFICRAHWSRGHNTCFWAWIFGPSFGIKFHALTILISYRTFDDIACFPSTRVPISPSCCRVFLSRNISPK